jgi:hypothetical protein
MANGGLSVAKQLLHTSTDAGVMQSQSRESKKVIPTKAWKYPHAEVHSCGSVAACELAREGKPSDKRNSERKYVFH